MWVDFIHSDLADVIQHRQTNGTDARIKFSDPRALRDLSAQIFDNILRNVQIALPECARRVVHRSPAKMFDHAVRPIAVLEVGTKDGIGALAVGVEPQAVQLSTEALTDQIEAHGKWLRGRAVSDDHDLCGLRATFHNDLQVACETQMGLVRVAGHLRIDKRSAHHGGDAIDQRVLNAAVWDMNHAVGAKFKQSQFGRTQTAPDGQPGAQPIPGSLSGNHWDVGQSVRTRQPTERVARRRGDTALAESRATRARGAVRVRHQCVRLTRISRFALACLRAHCAVKLAHDWERFTAIVPLATYNDSMDHVNRPADPVLSDDDVRACVHVLRAILADRSHLTRLTREQRRELLTLAGLVAKPERHDLVKMAKAFRRAEREAAKNHDRRLFEQAGLRVQRRTAVYAPLWLERPNPEQDRKSVV